MGLGQPAFKPLGVSATQGGGVIGREQSLHGLVHMDYAEITHETLCFQHCQRTLLAISPKHEISPQRGPQKTHAFDNPRLFISRFERLTKLKTPGFAGEWLLDELDG